MKRLDTLLLATTLALPPLAAAEEIRAQSGETRTCIVSAFSKAPDYKSREIMKTDISAAASEPEGPEKERLLKYLLKTLLGGENVEIVLQTERNGNIVAEDFDGNFFISGELQMCGRTLPFSYFVEKGKISLAGTETSFEKIPEVFAKAEDEIKKLPELPEGIQVEIASFDSIRITGYFVLPNSQRIYFSTDTYFSDADIKLGDASFDREKIPDLFRLLLRTLDRSPGENISFLGKSPYGDLVALLGNRDAETGRVLHPQVLLGSQSQGLREQNIRQYQYSDLNAETRCPSCFADQVKLSHGVNLVLPERGNEEPAIEINYVQGLHFSSTGIEIKDVRMAVLIPEKETPFFHAELPNEQSLVFTFRENFGQELRAYLITPEGKYELHLSSYSTEEGLDFSFSGRETGRIHNAFELLGRSFVPFDPKEPSDFHMETIVRRVHSQ